MDKTPDTDLSECKNGRMNPGRPASSSMLRQHGQPDFNAIPWPHKQPDLLYVPSDQLKHLMLQARKYDPRAIETFATLAIPVAKHYSSLPKVVSVLGKEEAYCIAIHTVMDFLMHERLKEGRQDIPTMLKQAIRCDLINQIDRIKNRRQFETYSKPSNSQSEDNDEDTDITASLPADNRLEPEQQTLQAEQKRLIQECLHYLSPKEKQVITGFFFRQLSMAEIAALLHCSEHSASQAKYSALSKLRKLFKEKNLV